VNRVGVWVSWSRRRRMAGRVRWAGRRWRGRASAAGEFVDVMPLVVVEA
jgi:hypothetical protein